MMTNEDCIYTSAYGAAYVWARQNLQINPPRNSMDYSLESFEERCAAYASNMAKDALRAYQSP